jgi:hypothetical protein
MRRLLTVLLLMLGAGATAQPLPERTVQGNRLSSQREPKISITVPQALTYDGARRFVLYGVADCEIHIFAETDTDGGLKRLVWVQFEGYLPERPDAHYGYNSPRHANLGGLDFFVDLYPRANTDAVRAGSDREQVDAMLAARGARTPAGMMYVRLVHLLNDSKRREVMIIYGEALPDQSVAAADLMAGGKRESAWPGMADALLARATQAIQISQ